MKLALNLVAIAAALVLQTTLTSFVPQTAAIDLVLIVVVYVSLSFGPTTGIVAGTVAGLIQDSLSSGIMGIGALAKTLVGFAAGRIGTQFIVTAPLPRFVVFIGATLLHALVFMGLYVLLGLREFPTPTPRWPDRPSGTRWSALWGSRFWSGSPASWPGGGCGDRCAE